MVQVYQQWLVSCISADKYLTPSATLSIEAFQNWSSETYFSNLHPSLMHLQFTTDNNVLLNPLAWSPLPPDEFPDQIKKMMLN